MVDKLYLVGQKMRVANADLAQGRVREAHLTYTDVLHDAPGHPYAFLHRSVALVLLGQPVLAVFDCWRAILAGQWAEKKADEEDGVIGAEGNFLGTYIKHYVAMYMHAMASKDPWTKACANGEVAGEDGRWLAQPLADFVVRKAFKRKMPADDYPHARWIILCGYYRLAYALFKCGGGALQSALNMINLATEKWCESQGQKKMFKDLQNHILAYIQVQFAEDEEYMRVLHAQDIIQLPRDRNMMEDNLFRGLMKSTYTTVPREQYPWDTYSITTDNFEELRPELEQFVKDSAPNTRLAATLSNYQHPTVKGKAPQLFLEADPKDPEQALIAFADDKGFFVWSRRTSDDNHCEGCGSLLNIDGDWIPPPHPKDTIFGSKDASMNITTPTAETPIQTSGSSSTASPSVEPDDRPRFENTGSQEEFDPWQALQNYAKDKFPENVAPVIPSSLKTQTEAGVSHIIAPEEDRPLAPTPMKGQDALEEQRAGAPHAGGGTAQGPEGERKDSIYPQGEDDPTRVYPRLPRQKSKPLPLTPHHYRHTIQDLDKTIDAIDGLESLAISIPKLRKAMAEMGNEPEADLRTCIGTRCSVLFCSKECEDKHAAAHDNVCDLGLEGTLPTIEQEKHAKIGGWWGGMVPTIPKQRVLTLMLRKVLTELWHQSGCQRDLSDEGKEEFGEKDPAKIPLQMPWIRLLDGNLNDPSPLPTPHEETGMHFENDLPDGNLQFLFPGYRSGAATPSTEDLARFKSHKLPFSLDYSVMWPISVLYNMGGFKTVFDVKRWDGWMLMTLMAKVEAATRIEHFIRFSKIIDAKGMINQTRCIDIAPTVRLHGFQRLQKGTLGTSPDHFTDPKLNDETELLVGSLHYLTNLVRVANPPEEKPTVRLVERNGEVFAFNWPIGTKLEQGTPLLAFNRTVWPFKLMGDLLEPDETPGIGGRWTSIKSETVTHLVRRGFEKSDENAAERHIENDAGETVEDLLMEYRHEMVVRRRGGAASRSPRDSILSGDEQEEDDDEEEAHDDYGDFEDASDSGDTRNDAHGAVPPPSSTDVDGANIDASVFVSQQQHDLAPLQTTPGYQALPSESEGSSSNDDDEESSDDDVLSAADANRMITSENDLHRVNRKLMHSLCRGADEEFSSEEEDADDDDDDEDEDEDEEDRTLLLVADRDEDKDEEGGGGSGGGVELPKDRSSSSADNSPGGVELPRSTRSSQRACAAYGTGAGDGMSAGQATTAGNDEGDNDKEDQDCKLDVSQLSMYDLGY